MMEIKSLNSINRLYRRGVNLCDGCERETAASCTERHLAVCNLQARYFELNKQQKQKKHGSKHNSE